MDLGPNKNFKKKDGRVPQPEMGYSLLSGMGTPVQEWATPLRDRVLPGQGWGTPPRDRTADGVLDTRRAVCLLRSRRRTFLCNIIFG